jgi:hypothetical protein
MRRSFLPLLIAAVTMAMAGCGLNCTVQPSITGQPSNQSATVGQAALFTVAASGSNPVAYQWLKNGSAIPGADQPSYVTPPTISGDSGSKFTVIVSNAYGVLSSSAASLTVNPASASSVRFVALNGNDANEGTIDQPYQTIQHCASTVAPGWTCEVRAGTYRETVTPNSGITIAAYNQESVTIDGSDPVSGWTRFQGNIYKASVTLRSDDTNQVFVGNQMMTEARWPNGNDLFHVNWATAQTGTDTTQIVDNNIPAADWTGAKIHLWSGADPFGHTTGTVTAGGSGQVSIANVETGTCPDICPAAGGFYYLFGTLAALDAEREWYYDSNSGTLYFMAPGQVDPSALDVRSKQRRYAFDLRGKSGVTIQNVGIFACSIVTDSASTNNTLDRVNAQYVSHFTALPTAANDPTGSGFSILQVHEGDSGIVINGTGNVVENSTISFSAGAGIALEGSNNIIRNNLIENVDYIGDYASGIDLDGNGNTIQYNTIQSVGRQAIYPTAVVNEDIGYNNIGNAMMLSRDGGAIYACCTQIASGSRIHHNWIHDTTTVVNGTADDQTMAGIVFDNGTSGFEVDQNVLWNNERRTINVFGVTNTGPNNTYIHNNSIPDSWRDSFVQVANVSNCSQIRIVDNQVVLDVQSLSNGPGCILTNNDSAAAGATEMTPTSQVGCNFNGCSSYPPPAVVNGNSVTPCPVTGTNGP